MSGGRTVLVAGATGFVGRNLVARLLGAGVGVRALVRDLPKARAVLPPGTEFVTGGLDRAEGLAGSFRGIRTAYYLVHSMGSATGGDFAAADRQAAAAFVAAASDAGVEQILYVGGLGDDAPSASEHLASRREVGRILRSGGPAVTQLRAGIVVGAGGSSFEMIVQLAERLPLMICPRWIDTPCQPIAVDDLVRYLVGCGGLPEARGRTFDVGGPEVLTYSEMLLRVGGALGRRPCLVILPRFTPSLSAHWVGYITDVPAGIARPVIDGMAVAAVCRESSIRNFIPGPLQDFDQSVREALRARTRRGDSPTLRGGHLLGPLEGRSFRIRSRGAAQPSGSDRVAG